MEETSIIKDLKNVTLLLIDGVGTCVDGAKALIHCSHFFNFGEVKYIGVKDLIGEIKDPDWIHNYTFHKIDKMTWGEYGHFAIKELHRFIDTEFVLMINDDGFILNPANWTDEYLEYDFIGAPWSTSYHFGTRPPGLTERGYEVAITATNLVGNGGFSLRSKKFLKVAADCPYPLDRDKEPEDVYLCLNNYDHFISHGIKYAPIALANRFSDQWSVNYDRQFGFHGSRDTIKKIKIKGVR